jgi:hypothetical protein
MVTASVGGNEPLEALAAVDLFLYTVTSHVGEGRGGSLAGNRGDKGKSCLGTSIRKAARPESGG